MTDFLKQCAEKDTLTKEDRKRLVEIANKLADGRMVELICKEGDILYCIDIHSHEIYTEKVAFFDISGGKVCNIFAIDNFDEPYSANDFGKTVFLTKPEALLKLREGEQNG